MCGIFEYSYESFVPMPDACKCVEAVDRRENTHQNHQKSKIDSITYELGNVFSGHTIKAIVSKFTCKKFDCKEFFELDDVDRTRSVNQIKRIDKSIFR